MEDCLVNVIRLSRTQCECFEEGQPTDPAINEGQAEVYLDEVEGFNLKVLAGAADCGSGSLWEIMSWAREEATRIFKADLLSCISLNYDPIRKAYSGIVGQTNFTGNLALTGNQAAIVVSFPRIVGGVEKIKRIGLALNGSAPINVSVYNNDENQSTPIATYTINSTANQLVFAELSSPLELPLWSNNVEKLEYYFVYDRGSLQPKDNKSDCGCGGTPPAWKQWITVKGINGSGVAFSTFTKTNYLNGIVLDVDLRCQTARLICSDEQPLDFENNGWDMQIAYAIRWKAGALVFQKILDSAELNRYTLMDREKTYGMRNHCRKQYNDFIAYLCENKEIVSGCLKCKQNTNFSMGNIIA